MRTKVKVGVDIRWIPPIGTPSVGGGDSGGASLTWRGQPLTWRGQPLTWRD